MQDIVWFAGVTAAVASAANILSRGNRLAICVALYFVFGVMHEVATPDHMPLRFLGLLGQCSLAGLAIARLIEAVQQERQHEQREKVRIVHKR